MTSSGGPAALYEELADAYDRRGEARQRDIFLVLAADSALAAGHPDQAERVRQRLLLVSPYHLLKPYPSFREALLSPDILDYTADLRNQYTPEKASQLLEQVKKTSAPTKDHGPPTPHETLVGSSRHSEAPAMLAPDPRRRHPSPSPYANRALVTPNEPSDEPVLAWVPGLLFLVVLSLGVAWAIYALGGPFLN